MQPSIKISPPNICPFLLGTSPINDSDDHERSQFELYEGENLDTELFQTLSENEEETYQAFKLELLKHGLY